MRENIDGDRIMVKSYNCPSCGGDMIYDPNTKKLTCGQCGNQQQIENDGIDQKDAAIPGNTDDDQYHCPDCGAIVPSDKKDTSGVCEYCGASLVLADRLVDDKRPQMIIPFETDRKAAEAAFKKWCHNGRFTPKGFMTPQNLKRLKGIYVPYFLYDGQMRVKLHGTGTRVEVSRQGNTEYTRTSYFDIYRDVEMSYQGIPCDASIKLDDAIMEKLEPYDYGKIQNFYMPYLAGYVSNQYDQDKNQLMPNAVERMTNYAVAHAKDTVGGYSSVVYDRTNAVPNDIEGKYVLLPIWFIDYMYQDKEYNFVMNGQSGKVIGKPPVSKAKVFLWGGTISAVIFVLLMVIGVLF